MSLLVPDYSSSSDDEEQTPQPAVPALPTSSSPPASTAASAIVSLALPPPASATSAKKTTKKRRVTKKPKTTLFLHPDIQRLLESGSSRGLGDDSDSDDDPTGGGSTLLAKQKKAVAAKRPRTNNAHSSEGRGLSFLPAPKHTIEEPKQKETPPHKQEEAHAEAMGAAAQLASQQQGYVHQQDAGDEYAVAGAQYDAATTAQYQQYYQGYYDPTQYASQQQQVQYGAGEEQYYQGEEDASGSSSKRARNRERELERALQQGNFHRVASKIIEVQGPAPNAWQPPVDNSDRSEQNSGEVKVQASFWNAQAGARVATAKPNRMQRQKHQLNQLAFDAKLREHELLDKKGASLKTKAETHAKYGW